MEFNTKLMKIEHYTPDVPPSSGDIFIRRDMDAVVRAQCILQAGCLDGTKYRYIQGDYDALVTIVKCHEEIVPQVTEITKESTVEQKCYWLLTMHRYQTSKSMYELLMRIQ